MVQWLGLSAFTAMGPGSIPGQGTKIWHAQRDPKGEEKVPSQAAEHLNTEEGACGRPTWGGDLGGFLSDHALWPRHSCPETKHDPNVCACRGKHRTFPQPHRGGGGGEGVRNVFYVKLVAAGPEGTGVWVGTGCGVADGALSHWGWGAPPTRVDSAGAIPG